MTARSWPPVPTVLPSGVSTSPGNYFYSQYPMPTPPAVASFFTDFLTYDAEDFTVTSDSTGSNALTAFTGGALLLTTAATDNDKQGLQLPSTSFKFATGAQMWFMANVSLGDATDCDLLMGFGDTFADDTPTDGVYFKKVDGSTTMNLLITNTSTSTTIPVGTMVTNTRYAFGLYYNAAPSVPTLYVYSTIPYAAGSITGPTAFGQPYYKGGAACVASANSLGGTSSTGAYVLTNLPAAATALTSGILLQAGSAAVRTATVDYWHAAQTIPARY